MLTPFAAPQNLTEAIRYFAHPDRSLAFMVQLRWPDGVACARCGDTDVSYLKTRRIWKCKGCKRQFSVKVGTIFEDSPLGLDKWLPALYLIANCKDGISSYELARSLGVTQKTGWFMLHRIRLAMRSKSFDRKGYTPLNGEVEPDETFIGGTTAKTHNARRERVIVTSPYGAKQGGKVTVMGLLQRGNAEKASTVKAHVVPTTKRKDLQRVALASIEAGSTVHTDAHASYDQFG